MAKALFLSLPLAGHINPSLPVFLADMRDLPERMDELSWLLVRTTAELLAEQLEEFRALRPDYLIADSVAPWGQWVAAIPPSSLSR